MLDVYNPKPIDEEERIFRQRRGLLEYEEEFSPIAGSLRDSPPAQDTTVQDLRREPFKTLHLVVKRTEDDPWDLPFAPLLKSEYLHTGAQRMIDSLVDTEKHGVCLIGRVPILHYEVKSARAKVRPALSTNC